MKLFKHQTQSVRFLAKRLRVLDLSDPGTGKTGVHATDGAQRRKKGGGKILVIAPRTLLWAAWATDLHKFCPDMRTSVATATNRAKAFAVEADFYITNHDAAVWLAAQPKKFFKDFETLIIDESTAYKHMGSARSKAILKISKHFKYRRALTGTPTSNSITDLWHQALIIDDGQRLGTSFYAFRSATCTPIQVGPNVNMVKWVDKEGAETAVMGLLKDIVIRHRFTDCIDIPPNHEFCMPVQLSAKHMAAYRMMEDTQILWLKGQSSVTAINAASVTTKLLQIASGAVYNDEGERQYTEVDTERYELIAELAHARDHVVIFFHWQHQKAGILKMLDKFALSHTLIDGTVNDRERQAAVEGFQAGSYRCLVAHPQAAGHGLTLTRASATIWAGPTYNLEHYLQGKRRIDRPGQKRKTETIVLIAENTIDERVWEVMSGKRERQSLLLDYLSNVKRAA
jgi:SNF2 family DNA or RNA helicase